MRRSLTKVFLFLLFFVGQSGFAYAKSALNLTEAKILIPLKGTTVTAGYGIFKNSSDQPVNLKIKTVKPFKAAELHETVEKDGKVGMNKVDQIVIPSRGSFELKPGSHHMMFFEPSRSLKLDEQLVAEFEENGKVVTFKFKVVSRETDSSHGHSHH